MCRVRSFPSLALSVFMVAAWEMFIWDSLSNDTLLPGGKSVVYAVPSSVYSRKNQYEFDTT